MSFRTIGIWVFGLLASAIIGDLIAEKLAPPFHFDWGLSGALAAMCAFACLRLWLARPTER